MLVSGFTFIRNGIRLGYPFLEAIQSILPLCDELVVAVGDSEDGSREAILALNEPKIRIIDTVWDEELRKGGTILAQQTNVALQECKGDICIYIQGDELMHEQDYPHIRKAITALRENEKADGLLFSYLHFHGSFRVLNATRRAYRHEIRIIKNKRNIFSYRDAQGFRKYSSYEAYLLGEKGEKLQVLPAHAVIYHYGYVRPPAVMLEKNKKFERLWHNDTYMDKKYSGQQTFDYYDIERVKPFTGTHPALIQPWVSVEDWEFDADRIRGIQSLKKKLIYFLEDGLKVRFGEYKNYHLLK